MAAVPLRVLLSLVPLLAPLSWGLLGYFPHRLVDVEEYSDIGRAGEHLCIAYHGDWGHEYCRAPGETDDTDWRFGGLACQAGEQRRPTWLDLHVERTLDGTERPFVISPYRADRDWLVENVEDCDSKTIQLRTVGGEIPGTGVHDPSHPFWGAYLFGPELHLGEWLPPPGAVIAVDRAAFAAAVARIGDSPAWDPLTGRGSTWGQVVMTCMLLLFDATPVAGTPVEELLALAVWAHGAWEAAEDYGPQMLEESGLPATLPARDPRVVKLARELAGLYPRDADVPVRASHWGTVKRRFEGPGG